MSRPGILAQSGLPVTAGLVAWYSADAITGLNNGDPVASWPDSSGNGNAAGQATQSKQPTYLLAGGPNGGPTVQFDGVDDVLNTLAILTPSLEFTMAALVYPSDVATHGRMTVSNGQANGYALGITSNSGANPPPVSTLYGAVAWENTSLLPTVNTTYALIVRGSVGGTTLDQYHGNISIFHQTGLTAPKAPDQFASMGFSPGNQYYKGLLSQGLVYSRAITDSEISLLAAYLASVKF